VTVQPTKVEDFVINAAHQNIIIGTVLNKLISLLIVSIVAKKVILLGNVQIMKKGYTEKEAHALDAVQFVTH